MNLKDLKPGSGVELEEDEGYVSPRSQSRRVALQALYQWQVNCSEPFDIIKQFSEGGFLTDVDVPLFRDLVNSVTSQVMALDSAYAPFLDRAVAMIDPIEKSILRLGVYELQSKPEIPYRVVINESVELAKRFGADESHRYINGILDKVAAECRQLEKSMPSSPDAADSSDA
ncbi:MAG: transcription antitermination factor NusB [Hydrogenovibrio sp.]